MRQQQPFQHGLDYFLLFLVEAGYRFELQTKVLIWSPLGFPEEQLIGLTVNACDSFRITSSVGCEAPAS
jgi:hypothetical protein